jgi:hypothetical protein
VHRCFACVLKLVKLRRPPPTILVSCRFVDPNDPSTIYLSQPVDESQRLDYQPVYAANYGKDEKYEPMNLRP